MTREEKKVYSINFELVNFSLVYNDTYSDSYLGTPQTYVISEFINYFIEEYSFEEHNIVGSYNSLKDITIDVEVSKSDLEVVIESLSSNSVYFHTYKEVDLDNLPDCYQYAYQGSSWNYVSLCADAKINSII